MIFNVLQMWAWHRPAWGIRVAEIQKRGQSKLTLQLTSFVVREMRVELTRRN